MRFNAEKKLEVAEEFININKKEEARDHYLKAISLAGGLGFSIAGPIAGGAILGNFLDYKFNLAPRMTLFFLFIGFIISILSAYRFIKDSLKE